jgi:hypothetical protein
MEGWWRFNQGAQFRPWPGAADLYASGTALQAQAAIILIAACARPYWASGIFYRFLNVMGCRYIDFLFWIQLSSGWEKSGKQVHPVAFKATRRMRPGTPIYIEPGRENA